LRSDCKSSTAFWRAAARRFRLDVRDFLDLNFQDLDLGTQRSLRSRCSARSHWKQIAQASTTPPSTAEPASATLNFLALEARSLRQQVDQNHCRNLRIASPQAVR
jgi:hypothetical protein